MATEPRASSFFSSHREWTATRPLSPEIFGSSRRGRSQSQARHRSFPGRVGSCPRHPHRAISPTAQMEPNTWELPLKAGKGAAEPTLSVKIFARVYPTLPQAAHAQSQGALSDLGLTSKRLGALRRVMDRRGKTPDEHRYTPKKIRSRPGEFTATQRPPITDAVRAGACMSVGSSMHSHTFRTCGCPLHRESPAAAGLRHH